MSEQLSKEDVDQKTFGRGERFFSFADIETRGFLNGEFMPNRQSRKQCAFEARIKDMGESLGKQQGVSRRQFNDTAEAWPRPLSP